MAIQTVGNRSFEGGKEIETGARSHKEAVAAAAKRASPASSVAVDATVMAAISLAFGDARRYRHVTGEIALLKQATEELQHRDTTLEVGDYFGVWEKTREVVLASADHFDEEWEAVDPEPVAPAPPEPVIESEVATVSEEGP